MALGVQGLPNEAFTLLILDSEPVFARGLAKLLEENTSDFHVVGILFSSSDSEEIVSKLQPDVVIMDARFGLEPGLHIRTMSPNTRVVLVSRTDEALDVQDALRGHIQGCFVRESELGEIVDALRLVLHDHIVVHTALVEASLTTGQTPCPLTQTEQEILRGISRGEGNRQIAARLHVSDRTIRRRILQIYSKLGVTDRVEAAAYAGRHGLFDAQLAGRASRAPFFHSIRTEPQDVPVTP
ncbi:MAG TPA: response regulator transcription factor [Acidimicrobiales bacterium]|nr:response regulator transcription factor [Acidimicrobiales bacterium]